MLKKEKRSRLSHTKKDQLITLAYYCGPGVVVGIIAKSVFLVLVYNEFTASGFQVIAV